MITTSIIIQDQSATIEAGTWRKLTSHQDMVYIKIENVERGHPQYGIDEERYEAEMLLDRKEAIAFGHALVSLGESL